MSKILFSSVFVLATVLFTAQSFSLEARGYHRCHNRTNVHVGVGTAAYNRGYVVQRYARPAPVPVVYAAPYATYAPVYVAPAYPVVYQEPVCYEEVYVAPVRPSLFSGLSFSWNFCR